VDWKREGGLEGGGWRERRTGEIKGRGSRQRGDGRVRRERMETERRKRGRERGGERVGGGERLVSWNCGGEGGSRQPLSLTPRLHFSDTIGQNHTKKVEKLWFVTIAFLFILYNQAM
jgi:hypothetical protein